RLQSHLRKLQPLLEQRPQGLPQARRCRSLDAELARQGRTEPVSYPRRRADVEPAPAGADRDGGAPLALFTRRANDERILPAPPPRLGRRAQPAQGAAPADRPSSI